MVASFGSMYKIFPGNAQAGNQPGDHQNKHDILQHDQSTSVGDHHYKM